MSGTGYDAKYARIIKGYRFTLYKFSHVADGRMCEKWMIVIRHVRSGLIVNFTKYEDLLLYRRVKDFNVWSGNPAELWCLCQFLQYVLIDNYEKFCIRDIRDVTKDMIQQWVWEYAATPLRNGEYPREESVAMHRNIVCQFIWLMCNEKTMRRISKEDVMTAHYVEKRYGTGYQNTMRKEFEYRIGYRCYDQETGLKSLNRDMPDEFIPLLIKVSEVYDPQIAFAVVLQADGGFRNGEICSMRRVGSKYGDGIIRTIEDGEVTAIQFDISKEFALRDDKKTGGIKKERLQEIFGPFVPIVEKYYQKHLKQIRDKPCDDSMPMFLNKYPDKNGVYQAMTVSGYRKRVKKLFDLALEQCRNSSKPELVRYYDKMKAMNFTWGPHAFRHWYTVRLIQYGCDATLLKDFRGDKSELSAQTYMKEKGVLRKEYNTKMDELGKLIRTEKEV